MKLGGQSRVSTQLYGKVVLFNDLGGMIDEGLLLIDSKSAPFE